MDYFDYPNYVYVHHHLKSLLREWNKIKPSFEAKLTTKHRISSHTRNLLILSLSHISKRIAIANSDLLRLINHVRVFCVTYQLSGNDLLYKPNMGVSLYNNATGIAKKIKSLREKFEIDEFPFKMLPYEFQSRLVALLPPRDCIAFRLAGKTAAKYVSNRGFSIFLLVAKNTISYKKIKSKGFAHPKYDITSTSRFLNSNKWYVNEGLYISMNSTEKFDRAVEIVSGTFLSLEISGPYTWKHAIQLMNVSKELKDVCLRNGMLLEAEDFDDFFEAVVKWLNNQKNSCRIKIHCPDLTVAFNPRIEEYIKNRATCFVYVTFYSQSVSLKSSL